MKEKLELDKYEVGIINNQIVEENQQMRLMNCL